MLRSSGTDADKTGVHTELRVQRNRPGHHRRVTDVNVIELIRELIVCQLFLHS